MRSPKPLHHHHGSVIGHLQAAWTQTLLQILWSWDLSLLCMVWTFISTESQDCYFSAEININHYWAVWTMKHFIISGFPNAIGCVKGTHLQYCSTHEWILCYEEISSLHPCANCHDRLGGQWRVKEEPKNQTKQRERVSGSNGPSCSQSTQVDGPAYQLHEPAREELTRHNQTEGCHTIKILFFV